MSHVSTRPRVVVPAENFQDHIFLLKFHATLSGLVTYPTSEPTAQAPCQMTGVQIVPLPGVAVLIGTLSW